MPRYSQQLALERMIEETSFAEVLYDLGVILRVRAETAKEEENWIEFQRLDNHAILLEVVEDTVQKREEEYRIALFKKKERKVKTNESEEKE